MGTDNDPLGTRCRRMPLAVVVAVLAALGLGGAATPVAAGAPGADSVIVEGAIGPAPGALRRQT